MMLACRAGGLAMKNVPSVVALALGLALLAWPSQADEFEHRRARVHRHHHHHGYSLALPRERHVIEVVRHAYGPKFIINGTNFTAKTPACLGWTAGDRIRLLAGSWHGACVDAAFYNVTRHRHCEMWCG
jgi:hypothetical protein